MSQKITPFLWFDDDPQTIVGYYSSIFKDTKVQSVNPMFAAFVIHGQDFMALKGGPMFKFNEAVSFFVRCQDQAEVDYLWSALTANGGAPGQCGWLKDKYGVSWQIVPAALGTLMQDGDAARVARVTRAFMAMKKFDIAALYKAYEGR